MNGPFCHEQGDRVGICLTQLDAALVERGVACTPGALPTFTGAIAAVDKIRFYVGHMPSKLKVHVTVGHQTVMGEVQFFGLPDNVGSQSQAGLNAVMSRMDTLTVKVCFYIHLISVLKRAEAHVHLLNNVPFTWKWRF